MVGIREARRTVEQAADKVVEAAGDTKRAIVIVGAIAAAALLIALCGLALAAGSVHGHRRLAGAR